MTNTQVSQNDKNDGDILDVNQNIETTPDSEVEVNPVDPSDFTADESVGSSAPDVDVIDAESVASDNATLVSDATDLPEAAESALDGAIVHPLAGMPGVTVKKASYQQDKITYAQAAQMMLSTLPDLLYKNKINAAVVAKWQDHNARNTVEDAVNQTRALADEMNTLKNGKLRGLTQFIEATGMTSAELNNGLIHDETFKSKYQADIAKELSGIDENTSYEFNRKRESLVKAWEKAEQSAQSGGVDISGLRDTEMNELQNASKNLATGVKADGSLVMEEDETKDMIERLKLFAEHIVAMIRKVLRLG